MIEETYERWLQGIQKKIDNGNCQWNLIGTWCFPTGGNGTFHDIMVHYCRKYWQACMNNELVRPRNFEKCAVCGELVPDGIKMIALLEKL